MLWKGVLSGHFGFTDCSEDLFLSIYQDCLFHYTTKHEPVRTARRSITFADVKGLPLESVYEIAATDPTYTPGKIVPRLQNNYTYWTRTLQNEEKCLHGLQMHLPAVACIKRTCQFAQPGTLPNFYDRVQSQNVLLECVTIKQSFVHGTVRVMNIAYHKDLVVRWTQNNWTTTRESHCTYSPGLLNADRLTDRFTFVLPMVAKDNKIEFVIQYRTNDMEYWDNNTGHNYVITIVQ